MRAAARERETADGRAQSVWTSVRRKHGDPSFRRLCDGIVALVLLPLFLLSSVEGRLLKPLGFAYLVALTASVVVALTVTPVLCSWLLPHSKMIAAGEEPRLTRRLKAWYAPWLLRALTHWRAVVAGAAPCSSCVAGCDGRSILLPEFKKCGRERGTIGTTSRVEALGDGLERLMLLVPDGRRRAETA